MENILDNIDEKVITKKENTKENEKNDKKKKHAKNIKNKEKEIKDSVSIVNLLQKGSDGYYNYHDLINLDLKEFIELFINETSYQETMNVVRLESYKNSEFSEINC